MWYVKFDCVNGEKFRVSNRRQLLYFLLDLLQFLPSLSGCVILRFKGDNVEFKQRRGSNVIYNSNRIRCVDYPETSLSRRDSMKRKGKEKEKNLPLLG
jgi:hypothetical protein